MIGLEKGRCTFGGGATQIATFVGLTFYQTAPLKQLLLPRDFWPHTPQALRNRASDSREYCMANHLFKNWVYSAVVRIEGVLLNPVIPGERSRAHKTTER